MLTADQLANAFQKRKLQTVFDEVLRYGTICEDKRNTICSVFYRWVNAVHAGMQWQFELKAGDVVSVKMSTQNNLFVI